MSEESISVADIFRRAQALRQEHPDWPYPQVGKELVKEFNGRPFPSLHNLTIPEQDARAPEEDWSAGLPIVRRGIQFQDWNEVISGILLSLEQTENYERERGPEGTRDDWHDRSVGIEEQTNRALSKWMPEELLALAEKSAKHE
jgi:hypothetical protein